MKCECQNQSGIAGFVEITTPEGNKALTPCEECGGTGQVSCCGDLPGLPACGSFDR